MGKYLMMGITLIVLIICIVPFTVNHQNNTMSAERVMGVLQTSTLGAMRDNPENVGLDMEDTIANLTTKILQEQSKHNRDMEISYVFFDNNNQITKDKAKMVGVQYRVRLLDDKGKTQSETEKKLMLRKVES
ncbi:hypothetical protein CN495_07580 [Bacillus thuringiensis]|uniref:DUF3888 domain-containing protein n=1 Tax=Bacillus thuringiensis TaxID=1428 RepID=A0ABD6SEK3_BACTU|nr:MULTISPECIES: hypothetical protein [Bacillus cereus group]PER55606.1 hypothetical protein CN495_07580 [Bacillus thuringiensis]PGR83705.1 hypothetical protein COC63_06875 [Bacillus cereus]